MAKDTEKVSLGSGTLYLNNVDVGHLKGDVEFTYTRGKVEFKPSNMLGIVKQFVITEEATLKASLAELKLANIKLALGVSDSIGSSQSFPEYDPSSFVAPSGASYDVLTFGGSKTVDEMSLRFEHIRPGTSKKIIIVLYNAVSMSEFTLPFHEEDITLHDLVFKGLSDADRSAGDRIGVIVDQVLTA